MLHWGTHAHDLGLHQYQKSRGRLATPTAGDRRLEPDSPVPLLQLPTHSTACPWGVQGSVHGSLGLRAAAEMDFRLQRGGLQGSGSPPRPLNQSSWERAQECAFLTSTSGYSDADVFLLGPHFEKQCSSRWAGY